MKEAIIFERMEKKGYFRCKDVMPDNDRYVLIYSKHYFGKGRWHPAAWMGEDDEPDEFGPWNWTIDAQALSKEEVKATHWMEMPGDPVGTARKKTVRTKVVKRA